MKVTLLNYTPLYICSDAIRTCWMSQDKSDTKRTLVCDTCGNYESESEEGFQTFEVNIGDDVHHECLKCSSEKNHFEKRCGEKDRAIIDRVANQNKHSSTIEHLYYNFHISGISRACLQELARHRIASLSVKSTRYTLKELKSDEHFMNGWCITDTINEVDWNEDGYERAKKYLVMTGDFRVDICSIGALDNLRELLLMGISNDKAKFALPEAYKTELAWSINARSLQNFLSLRTDKSALWEIRDLAYMIYEALPEDHRYLFEDAIN